MTSDRTRDAEASECATDFRSQVRAWNRTSADLVADYADTTVSAEVFLTTSDATLPQLERVVGEMEALQRRCAIWPTDEITETYQDKLSGYTALSNAVRLGSEQAERDALAMLEGANQRSIDIACELAAETGEDPPGMAADQC